MRYPKSTAALSLLIAVTACAAPENRQAPPPPATNGGVPGTVTIWRGVKVLPNSTNIDWSKNSFGVSGSPTPTLSFFDAQGQGQQCWLRVTVDAPSVPVTPGSGGTVTLTIPPPPPAIGASPWAAIFDNSPAGHWSITKDTITGGAAVSNAVAGTYAGLVFQASAAAGQVSIVDGTVAGCHQ